MKAAIVLAIVLVAPAAAAQEPDELRVGGRVFVRDTLSGIPVAGETLWREERTLDSARAMVSFRPNKRTRMDLEVDFAGDEAELKDTFIAYEPHDLVTLTAGRFKRPVSFLGLESAWEIPRIDRGLLSELRIGTGRLMFAGGRGDGLAIEVDLPGSVQPELTLVVHQSELADELMLEVTDAGQDLFARAEIEPAEGLHLAVAGGWVGALGVRGDPASYRHRGFGTVEAFLERDVVRVWIEGMAGLDANTYVGNAQRGWFAAAQALVAPRLEQVGSLRALEPYAAAAWYQPSMDQEGDRLVEATAGLAIWVTGKLRLQLEGARRVAEGDTAPARDATILRIQLGAAFRTKVEIE